MPTVDLRGARIYYERFGPGPDAPAERLPVLLLAPGGLRSRVGLWRHTHDGRPRPWPDPTVELARVRPVVAMDQRNAGFSRAPVTPQDDWDTFAADQLGLMDALGIERFHVMGACIGTSFALRLAELAPQRVVSAVLQQPIGWTRANGPLRPESFEAWAAGARAFLRDVPESTLQALEHNLYGGEDFVFSVTRETVRKLQTPLLILAGDDVHHPVEISRELESLAPNVRYVEAWKGEANRRSTIEAVNALQADAEAALLVAA